MVKRIKRNNKLLYQCEECGFLYLGKEWALKCERWCKENHSCSLEITKHTIK